MAFLCETPEPTPAPPATQTVVQQSDPLFRDAFNRVFNRADVIAGQPYQPYGGQRIAGLTADTQAGFGLTRANVGAYQPFVGLAGANAAQAGLSLPQRNVAAYMNPYVQNVVDIAKREAIRGDSIAQQGRNFAARQAGAFGGSRHGIVEAEAQRNLGQRLDDIQQQGLAAGFDKAMTAIDRESQNQTRSALALGDLGSRASQLGFADATALDTIGTRQQQQEQANLDVAYRDFLAQRDYDRDQVRFLSDIMNRAPQAAMNTSRTSETTQFTPQASPISQAAGLATAGVGAFGLGKWAGLWAEGGEVAKRYAEGGLASLNDAEVREIYNDGSTSRERKQQALEELRRRGVGLTGRQPFSVNIPGLNRANPDRARPAEPAPMPPGLAPRYAAPDVEENAPQRPMGTTGLSAVPPELSMAPEPPAPAPRGLSLPEPPAPPAPSRANMPPAFNTPDLVGEAQRGLGATQTPAQARAAVKEREAELMKDPMEGLPRWVMPVLQAGLAMMQAKPGQSALSGIGAGAQVGVQEAANMRKEAMERERENTRRKERAQDLTERERQAAAQDAAAARQEVFTQAGLRAQQAGMDFNTWKAQLDTALQERRLTLEQYNASLNGYRAGLDTQRLKLEDRRAGAQEEVNRAYAGAASRQGMVTLFNPETNETIFIDPTKDRAPPGFRPVGSLSATSRDEDRRLRISSEVTRRMAADPTLMGLPEAEKARRAQALYKQIETEMYGAPTGGGGTMPAGPPPLNLPPRQ